jgi:hypothetical protein
MNNTTEKTIYFFNKETNLFRSSHYTTEETIPSDATNVCPPAYSSDIGQWIKWTGNQWDVVIVNQEIFLSYIRTKRDALLAETDWAMVTDSKLSLELQAKVEIYRQALRDITKQDPNNIVWPVNPLAK